MPDDYRIRKVLESLEEDPAKRSGTCHPGESQQLKVGTFIQASDGSGFEPFSRE